MDFELHAWLDMFQCNFFSSSESSFLGETCWLRFFNKFKYVSWFNFDISNESILLFDKILSRQN